MPLFPPQDYRKTAFTHRRGLRTDQPLATDVLPGTLYFVTDEIIIERSTGVVWESYSGSGSDHVLLSDGVTPTPLPIDDGFGNFVYIPYTP